MVALFSCAGKLQFLMISLRTKARNVMRTCLPLIFAQAGTFQGLAGLVGLESLRISKQSFPETALKLKEALPVKKRSFSYQFAKLYPRIEKT